MGKGGADLSSVQLPARPPWRHAVVTTSPAAERRTRRATPTPARRVLAVFLLAHGVAHLAGTSDAFSRAADRRSADYLAGGWTISDPTTLRAFGVVWAVLAVGLAGAAVLTWTGRRAWPTMLWWVALASLAFVLVALWASVIGVVIDLALLAVAWRAGSGRHDAGA